MFAALQSQEILAHWLKYNLLSKNKTRKLDEVSKNTQKRTDQNINDQSNAKHIQFLLLLLSGQLIEAHLSRFSIFLVSS